MEDARPEQGISQRRRRPSMASANAGRLLAPLAVAALVLTGGIVACEPNPPTTTTTTTTSSTTTTTTPPTTPTGTGDGKSAANAGVSCWGIKQQHAASATGTYWLLTPAMDRPAQFYCDMSTNGGGWVLLGRGREGWTFQPTGQGSASAVRTTVSGSGAFSPAALDSATINDLMNGGTTSSLSDGVRLERATNTAGTTSQDYRIYLRNQKTWNWTFHGGHLLSKVTIDGTTYTGGNTRDTFESEVADQGASQLIGQQGTKRLFTWPWDRNDNKQGFSFGSGAPTGSTSSTTHLWQRASNSYALPFTRVWIRPKLANTTAFAAVPTGGYAAAPEPARLKDRSELAPWGVVGMNHTGEQNVEPWNSNVLAIETTATRVFVGGRFTGVQQGPTASPVSQPSLAAFDLDGNWISTFRPTVAGRVWDLATMPDGKLLVAGDFTSINGVTTARGLAVLDPTTGAVSTGWKAQVSRVGGTEWRVRTVDIRGTTIYAAGLFDRVQGGTATTAASATHAISLSTANGTVGTWKPTPNGSVVDITVTGDGTRVLMAGLFTAIGGSATHGSFGITNASNGAITAGTGTWQPSGGTDADSQYQQAVADLGDRLVVGGSQHNIQVWNKARTTMLDSSIQKPGGDTQAIEIVGSKAYIGCHCGGWTYLGTNEWLYPTGFRSIEALGLVGVWDTATWTYDTSWYPGSLRGATGEGVWAIDADTRGCLWVGGDLNRGAFSGTAATDWLGGFARFCPLDTTVPTTPGGVTVTSTGTSRKIAWSGSTDPDGTAPTYDVIRNGNVIATVSSSTRSYTDPSAPAGTKYTVRAFDARGNRSGSSAPITV